MRYLTRRLSGFVLALGVASGALGAQGITSAALEGRVVQADGTPIEGATISATSAASGAHWRVATNAAGRFFLENVPAGGLYDLEVRRIGFRPARRGGIRLALGQRLRMDFALESMVLGLPEVTVSASADSRLNSGRTGPEHVVSGADFARLPNAARDLTLIAALAPLAVVRPLGGISIGGQNQGFNSFQIDGGANADAYLGRSPGGASPSGALPEVLPRAISLEAVSEVQVLAAPFDVRLGNFAGGLLNAVTKSGTNYLEGAVFGFVQSGRLVGRNAGGDRIDFTTRQFGGTFSGPIVRDRVHFFVNADLQERVVPDPGPLAGDRERTAVSAASALRFQQVLKDSYGLEGGAVSSTGHLPAQDLFAKLTVQLGGTGRLELSQHYAHAERRGFMDVGRTFDSTALSSAASVSRSTARTSRLIWSALLRDRTQSELILSYVRLRDVCRPNESFPLIQVRTDSGKGTLIAGPNSVCPTTDVDQDALEATGNVTVGAGRHLVTLGSHVELLHFRDPLLQVSAGRWDFLSLDSLAAGRASHYDRGLAAPPPRSGGVDFRVLGLGVYAQDRWAPTDRLTLTIGLRVDVPTLPDAAQTNSTLAGRGIDTGRLPGGVPLWSPRAGVNYDLRGDGTSFFRGGIGMFTGPPPYRWLGNAYRDTGDERLVSCDSPRVPAFMPSSQPSGCAPQGGTSPRISYFDPGFRFPQNLKLALGVDRRLPNGLLGTIDLLYTRAVRQVYVTQANLGVPGRTAAGEGGRALYGSVDPASGRLTPDWLDTSSQQGEIYRLSNTDGDHALSISAQVRKQFGGMLAVDASYAYSRVRDRMSVVNFPARANFSNTPLDGTLDDRRLRPSFFETPHKVSVAATLGPSRRTQLTVLYTGASQPSFTYVVNGDANGDGIGGAGSLKNDIVYVPRDSSDIALATASEYARLDTFIEQHRCLREQRGRIMARGSCRNGWLGILNARVMTRLPMSAAAPRLEITADVFNLPNLVSPRWGRHRDVTTAPSITLLSLAGWDASKGRGRYRVPPQLPALGVLDDASSRWRVQLGARYYLQPEERGHARP
jgi:hypothetical protein